MAFGHSRRDGADADFGNQLDADARMMIGVLKIVNQLRQIFDGIDIVMRRRRDQTDSRRRVAHLGDPRIDFSPGQLAALSRLGALRHLDLQLSCLRQIVARHAKAARCHLFDRAIFRIAVGFEHIARRIFAALAGVALAADAVHRDGQRFVRFFADRAVGHGAGLEPLDDLVHRLHFLDRNRLRFILQAPSSPRSVAMRSD